MSYKCQSCLDDTNKGKSYTWYKLGKESRLAKKSEQRKKKVAAGEKF